MPAERAYKRLLRWMADQPGGEGEVWHGSADLMRRAIKRCEDRGLIKRVTTTGWMRTYRITDAGRAEIADAH